MKKSMLSVILLLQLISTTFAATIVETNNFRYSGQITSAYNATGGTDVVNYNTATLLISNSVNSTSNALQTGINTAQSTADIATTNYISPLNDATNIITSNLASVTPGSEGTSLIGTFGGYTLNEFIEDNATRGPSRDMPVFYYSLHTTNLTVVWSIGDVYDPYTGYHHLNSGSIQLVNNANNYAYWAVDTPNQVQWTTGIRPDNNNKIYLAKFITAFTNIVHGTAAVPAGDELLFEDVAFSSIMPSIITDGILAFATGTDLTNIILTGGTEYHDMGERLVHPTIDLSISKQLTYYGHSAPGIWSKYQTNEFPIGICSTNGIIEACDTTKWYRGIFVAPADTTNHLHFILPDNTYTSLVDALNGPDPDLPPGFNPYVPISTAYIYMGSDISLRTDSTYWQDDRFMIRRGTHGSGNNSSGGVSAPIPSLTQVLIAGHASAGILMDGLGFPINNDQVSSKGYVDSITSKAKTGSAAVDAITGDDNTARLESAAYPFKTIQAAIDATTAAATDIKRYIITLSSGIYVGDVTMHNFISVRGQDIEATKIYGQINWPSTYTDGIGTEIALVSVFTTNKPCILCDAGADDGDAYMGARSCALYSVWTQDDPMKCVVRINRGQFQNYASTWSELDNYPAAGYGTTKSLAYIYYCSTNASNLGIYRLDDFNGSHTIRCFDTNDTVGILYTDAAQDNVAEFHSCQTVINLQDSTNHVNEIRLLNHQGANGSTDSQGTICDIDLNLINNCTLIAITSQGAPFARKGSGIHYNSNRVRIPNISPNKNYYASSTGIYDYTEVFNSQLGPQTVIYPQRYTADGILGIAAYSINHASGDLLIGGGIDFNTTTPSGISPIPGHGLLSISLISGFERPYFQDSKGNRLRIGCDSDWTIYNTEATTLKPGELIYLVQGLNSGSTMYGKRAIATNTETCAFAFVVSTNGIATGTSGLVRRIGRIESGVDTSIYTQNTKLYLSSTIPGAFTNVPPAGPNIVQYLGRNQISAVSGSIEIEVTKPDTLGELPASYYASYTSVTSEIARATAAEIIASTNLQANIDNAALTGSNYTQNIALGLTNYIEITASGLTNYINSVALANTNYTDSATNGVVSYVQNTTLGLTNYIDAGNTAGTNYVKSVASDLTNYVQTIALAGTNYIDSATNNLQININGINTTATNALSIANIALTNYLATLNAYSNVLNQADIISMTNWQAAVNIALTNWQAAVNVAMTNYIAADNISRTNYVASFNVAMTNEHAYIDAGDTIAKTNLQAVITAGDNIAMTNYVASFNVAMTNWQAQMTVALTNWNYANSVAMTNYIAADTISRTNYVASFNVAMTNWNAQMTIALTNWTYANSVAMTNYVASDNISRTNYVAANNIAMTNYQGALNSYSNALNNSDIAINSIATNAQTQATVAFNYVTANSNKINTVITPIRFKANIGNANITYASAGNPTLLPMTNVVLAASDGSIYSNTVSQWWPKATNGIVKLSGGFGTTIANNIQIRLDIYKNGSLLTTVLDHDYGSGNVNIVNTWHYIDTTTPTVNDYYQLYYTVGNNRTSVNAGTNNWWFGELTP